MAKVKFEIEVGDGEVPTAVDMLKDLIEAFDFPEYRIGVDRDESRPTDVDELPPVECPEDFLYPTTGDLVEINGYALIVAASDISGELILVPRDELLEDE